MNWRCVRKWMNHFTNSLYLLVESFTKYIKYFMIILVCFIDIALYEEKKDTRWIVSSWYWSINMYIMRKTYHQVLKNMFIALLLFFFFLQIFKTNMHVLDWYMYILLRISEDLVSHNQRRKEQTLAILQKNTMLIVRSWLL